MIQPTVVEPGRSDNRVQTRLDAPLKVVHDGGRGSEVDNDLRLTQRLTLVPDVKSCDKLEVVSRINSATYLAAHAPLGAENANVDAHVGDPTRPCG